MRILVMAGGRVLEGAAKQLAVAVLALAFIQ